MPTPTAPFDPFGNGADASGQDDGFDDFGDFNGGVQTATVPAIG